MDRPDEVKSIIRKSISKALGTSVIPELGLVKKGKVRDIYMTEDKVIMVASDRVSAFDYVLPNLIPYKGEILNRITLWAFEKTKDIVPNALVGETIDPNVIVQKKMKNVGVEAIVRGYLWGSMAAGYEKGERTICGLTVADGLLRYQRFPSPIFTPTTKAPAGEHDENISMEEVAKLVGSKNLAEQVREAALKLYTRGSELLAKQGLMFIDTKYEFGTDENGKLFVIDEINTPDSSRMCDIKEWEDKYPKIEKEMKTGQYKDVSDLLNKKPELKIKEFSKQYVRDALIGMGFQYGKEVPKLTEDHVVECAYRYMSVFERITGQKFFAQEASVPVAQRLLCNLQAHNIAKGCCVVIMAGSDSDLPHLEKIQGALTKYGIPSHFRICSAHKQPTKLMEAIEYYNSSLEPLLIVGCAGGTDALSGTVSFHSVFPVVSCPPDGVNESCLKNPPGSSNAYILRPDNVAKFALQMFTSINPKFRQALLAEAASKISSLEKADKYHF